MPSMAWVAGIIRGTKIDRPMATVLLKERTDEHQEDVLGVRTFGNLAGVGGARGGPVGGDECHGGSITASHGRAVRPLPQWRRVAPELYLRRSGLFGELHPVAIRGPQLPIEHPLAGLGKSELGRMDDIPRVSPRCRFEHIYSEVNSKCGSLRAASVLLPGLSAREIEEMLMLMVEEALRLAESLEEHRQDARKR